MRKNTKIEMPYGTGKTIGFWRTICLTSYPPQYRYECSNCHSQVKEPGSSCPNCQTEMKSEMEALASEFVKNYADDRYGFGIADDMGLEKVSCKQCHYNTGKCEDCLFIHSKDCPEYKEVEDNDSIL